MPIHPWQKTERAERRRHPRLAIDAPGRMASGATTLEGRVDNLSDAGVSFVAAGAEPAFAVGSRVSLAFAGAGEDGGDLRLEGKVVRTDKLCDALGDSVLYAVELDPTSAN